MEHTAFPKIPRWYRDIVITEKIDGTNAQVFIGTDGEFSVGSRNRWISCDDDNYGFAKWAESNRNELLKLGPGTHYGEWWGSGIQRGYGLKEKRFSLFNTKRWLDNPNLPSCCSVVPVLYQGINHYYAVQDALKCLHLFGSAAAKGYDKPEGVIIYHTASNHCYKVTLEDDEKPKGVKDG